MIGIAIINYNTYEKTIECITSIRNNTHIPYRIYLIDNASTNNSKAILENEYSTSNDVVFIKSDINLGYARGNNLCIELMIKDGCDYCVISNNDILCHEKTIDMLYDKMMKENNCFVIAPKIVGIDGMFQNSFKIKKIKKLAYIQESTYLANFYKKRILSYKKSNESVDQFINVYWVSGAFFMINIEKFKNIGFFDPHTFLFYEESILSKKCQEKGYKIGYLPSAKVTHFHAASTGGGANIITKKASFYSEIYYWKKYEKASNIFLHLLRIIRFLEVVFTFGKRKELSIIVDFYNYSRKVVQDTKKYY